MIETFILINRPLHRHHGITGHQDRAYPIEVIAISERAGEWMIAIGNGLSGHDAGSSYDPAKAIEWRPNELRGVDLPQNYIEDQCKRLKCEWFIPLLVRMASGLTVDPSEIQSSYRDAYGGEDAPTGSFTDLQRSWLRMAEEFQLRPTS